MTNSRARVAPLPMDADIDEDTVIVRTPGRVGQPWGPYLRALWFRRHFVLRHSGGALRARNARNVLGPLWHVLNPTLLAGIYVFLFAVLRPSDSAGEIVPRVVSGVFFYYFTLQGIVQGGRSIIADRQLVLNSTFPLLALPVSAVALAGRELGLTLPVYAAIHFGYGRPVGWFLLLLLPLLLLQTILTLGFAALAAAVQTHVRDFGSFIPYVMRLALYVTPVLYAPEILPDTVRRFLYVNPLSAHFVLLHQILEGRPTDSITWGVAAAWSVIFVIVGATVFKRAEQGFAGGL